MFVSEEALCSLQENDLSKVLKKINDRTQFQQSWAHAIFVIEELLLE